MELILSHYIKLCERFLANEFAPGLAGADVGAVREMKNFAECELVALQRDKDK
jgi:hypothetical protein